MNEEDLRFLEILRDNLRHGISRSIQKRSAVYLQELIEKYKGLTNKKNDV